MSLVTNVILATPIYFDEELEKVTKQINKFFEGDQRGFVNCSNSDWYGGSKRLECELFVGAFNYLYLQELVEHLKTVEWGDRYGDAIQLIVKRQDDEEFSIIDIVPKDETPGDK